MVAVGGVGFDSDAPGGFSRALGGAKNVVPIPKKGPGLQQLVRTGLVSETPTLVPLPSAGFEFFRIQPEERSRSKIAEACGTGDDELLVTKRRIPNSDIAAENVAVS